MPRSRGDRRVRVEQRTRTPRLETREPLPKRRCNIRIADCVEDEIEGGELSVFVVGRVIDCVLDTTVPGAGQQRVEWHVAGAFTRAKDQNGASPAGSLLDENPLNSISALAINLCKLRVYFARINSGKVLARNRDVRIERQHERVPLRGRC